ncbi:MAG: phage holin family protein [Propionicimonas sp.]
MIRTLIRAGIFFGTAAIGLLLAALIVPGVGLTVSGFLVAVVVFAVAQSLITPLFTRLFRRRAAPLVGVMGLVSTGISLLLAGAFQGGLTFSGAQAWLVGALVVWLVTALGAWLLPLWLLKQRAGARSN